MGRPSSVPKDRIGSRPEDAQIRVLTRGLLPEHLDEVEEQTPAGRHDEMIGRKLRLVDWGHGWGKRDMLAAGVVEKATVSENAEEAFSQQQDVWEGKNGFWVLQDQCCQRREQRTFDEWETHPPGLVSSKEVLRWQFLQHNSYETQVDLMSSAERAA